MARGINRRDAIKTVAGAGLGFASVVRMPAQSLDPIPTWKRELRQLAPNVYAYVLGGGPGQLAQGVSNAGLIVADDHLLAFDSTGAPLHAKGFLAAARQAAPNKQFQRLILTHHHGDHIWGLPFFPKMEIVSHEYCRKAMLAMDVPPGAVWEKREGFAEGGEPRKIIAPDVTITGRETLYVGDLRLEVIPMAPAHTFGDLMIYLPQHKILFAGDLGFFWASPFLNNGVPSKWIEACDKILDMDVDVIVPGHGPIGGKRDLAATRDYIRYFKGEARLRYNAGMSVGRACADIKLGRFASWIGADERMPMNITRLYAEFAGTLTPDFDAVSVARAAEEYAAVRKSLGR